MEDVHQRGVKRDANPTDDEPSSPVRQHTSWLVPGTPPPAGGSHRGPGNLVGALHGRVDEDPATRADCNIEELPEPVEHQEALLSDDERAAMGHEGKLAELAKLKEFGVCRGIPVEEARELMASKGAKSVAARWGTR